MNAIHLSDARKLLQSGQPCTLKLWKISTGDILIYKDAVYLSNHFRGGTHNIKLLASGEIRTFRDVTLIAINNMKVFL